MKSWGRGDNYHGTFRSQSWCHGEVGTVNSTPNLMDRNYAGDIFGAVDLLEMFAEQDNNKPSTQNNKTMTLFRDT